MTSLVATLRLDLPPPEDDTIVEESKGNKTLPAIKSMRLIQSKVGSSMVCLSSVATFNSNRRRHNSPKNESPNGSPASRLFDLTSSMQNKQQPSHYPPFRSRLKLAKTKRGHSFKLKCTSVQQPAEGSNPEGLANMRLSLNFDNKRRSQPESQSQYQGRVEPLDQIAEMADVAKRERDLNDSDLDCLEDLRQTLTAKKKLLPVLQTGERLSHFSRESPDEYFHLTKA